MNTITTDLDYQKLLLKWHARRYYRTIKSLAGFLARKRHISCNNSQTIKANHNNGS